MSNAVTAFGTIISIDNGSSYTDIAEVKEITGPGLSVTAVDVTNHASANGYKEVIGGLKDGGEITFACSWITSNTQHAQILTDFEAKTVRNFKITLNSAAGSKYWTAACLITKFDPAYPIDGALGLQITLKVSGKPTLT